MIPFSCILQHADVALALYSVESGMTSRDCVGPILIPGTTNCTIQQKFVLLERNQPKVFDKTSSETSAVSLLVCYLAMEYFQFVSLHLDHSAAVKFQVQENFIKE